MEATTRYDASHNPMPTGTAEAHWHHTRRTMAAYLRQPVPLHSVWNDHQAILAAIVGGDARVADRLPRAHAEDSMKIILKQLFQGDDRLRRRRDVRRRPPRHDDVPQEAT